MKPNSKTIQEMLNELSRVDLTPAELLELESYKLERKEVEETAGAWAFRKKVMAFWFAKVKVKW